MSQVKIIQALSELYQSKFGHNPQLVKQLPISGSIRQYFRITGKQNSVIGTYNPDIRENLAFFYLCKHFLNKKLRVPEVIISDQTGTFYLQNDLGDETVFSMITKIRKNTYYVSKLTELYKNIISDLVDFQVSGHKNLDYSKCYPRDSFDRQSIQWDLNYFKYYFLKLSGIQFDEQKLEDSYQHFIQKLIDLPSDYFMYRDFQSRNIMIMGTENYYIDFQGGRKGTNLYDLASLLFDAKADLPQKVRDELLDYYLFLFPDYKNKNVEKLKEQYFLVALIRILQAFGAYGFRGFIEKKHHFLQSIPYAVNNLKYVLQRCQSNSESSYLFEILNQLTESEFVNNLSCVPDKGLTITVTSFSYKREIPTDYSGNGGGFVFDCRFLPNPGRFENFKNKTGLEKETSDWLRSHIEVTDFEKQVQNILSEAIKNYLARNFNHLMISFGCTGGQHRSVFFADSISKYLSSKFKGIKVITKHTEIPYLTNCK